MLKNNNNIRLELKLKASAFKLNHQFHLVDSSPLPFITVFLVTWVVLLFNSSELLNLNQISVFLLFSPIIKIQTRINLIKTSLKNIPLQPKEFLLYFFNWIKILIRSDLKNFYGYFENLICYNNFSNKMDLISTISNILTFKNIAFYFYFYTIWLNLKSVIWIWIFDNSKLVEYCYNNTKPGLSVDEIGLTFNETIAIQFTFIFFHFIFLYFLLHFKLTQAYISIPLFIPHVVIFYFILLQGSCGVLSIWAIPGFLLVVVLAFFNRDLTFINQMSHSLTIIVFFILLFIIMGFIAMIFKNIPASIWKNIKAKIKIFIYYFCNWCKNWSIRKDLEDFYCYVKTLICFYPDNARLNVGTTVTNFLTFKNLSFSFYFYVFLVNLKFSVWLCFFAEAGAGLLGLPLIDKIIQFSFILLHFTILYFLLYHRITKLKFNIFFFIMNIFLYFIILKQIQWGILAIALSIEIIWHKSYIVFSEAPFFPTVHASSIGGDMPGLQKDNKNTCENAYLNYCKKLQGFSSYCEQQQKILDAPYKPPHNLPHIPRGVGGLRGIGAKAIIHTADLGLTNSDKISATAKWTTHGCNSKWEELLKAQDIYTQCIKKK